MSTPPVAKPLNPYITMDLAKTERKYHRIAFAYQALNVISWVAISAIMASIFTVAYSGVTLSGGAALAALVAIISTYPLLNLAIYAKNQSRSYKAQATLEGKVIAEMKIQREYIEKCPSEERTQCHPPLLARYQVMEKEAKMLYEQALARIGSQNGDRAIRLQEREEGWRQLENEALPTLIHAAVLLHICRNPTLNWQLPYPNPTLLYPNIGECRPKSPQERFFDAQVEPRDNEYFRFYTKGVNPREPLQLGEFLSDPTPKAICAKLFTPQIK